ncbi:hypothetical protein [Conexibacter sp. SYSU D00693]|uniref:hypothetical protein n=1 Tax=Conexibacter sp. SYSU D00693 TaxID=2812560 RepID=UPI00196B3604|nr:hypothetical protein [Conexibacter sp. SYSU D00693]
MLPRQDEPLFLGRTGGLTRNPARAMRTNGLVEPEPVVGADLERFAFNANRDRVAARQLTLATLAAAPVDVRLARCRAQAKATKVDCHAQLRLVRLAIANGRSAEHVGRRLDAVERALWPDLTDA